LYPRGEFSGDRMSETDSFESLFFHNPDLSDEQLIREILRIKNTAMPSLDPSSKSYTAFWAPVAHFVFRKKRERMAEIFEKLVLMDNFTTEFIARAFEPYLHLALIGKSAEQQVRLLAIFGLVAEGLGNPRGLKERFVKERFESLVTAFAEPLKVTESYGYTGPAKVLRQWGADPWGIRALAYLDSTRELGGGTFIAPRRKGLPPIGALLRHNILSAVNESASRDDRITDPMAQLILVHRAFQNELRIEESGRGERRLVYRPSTQALINAEAFARAYPRMLSASVRLTAGIGVGALYATSLPWLSQLAFQMTPEQLVDLKRASLGIGIVLGASIGSMICGDLLRYTVGRRASQNLPKPIDPQTR
jgi:hypothetical protein